MRHSACRLLDLFDGGDDFRQPARRALGHRLDAAHLRLPDRHCRRDFLDLLADHARRPRHVFRRARRFVGELADFFRYHREPAAMLTGTRGFDGCV